MDRPKVFGIGFHKTGTSSLGEALEVLGYRVTGHNFVHDKHLGDDLPERAAKVAEQFDAFQDNPWPILFREMDERFRGSKFVLTVRDTDRWYASARRHFVTAETPMRRYIYGVGAPEGNETIFKDRYDGHNRDVLAHFSDRPDDLLVMDFSKGDGWDKLCPFLGLAIPDAPFPHANPAGSKAARLSRKLLSRLGLERA